MTKKSVAQCSVDGCLKSQVARKMCWTHYGQEYKRTGPIRKRPEPIVGDICYVDGCDKPHAPHKRYCYSHEWRKKRYSDVNMYRHNIGEGDTFVDRFWSRVRKGDNDDCWEWAGSAFTRGGYGVAQLTVDGRKLRFSHRVAYYLSTGNVPSLMILHSCDNPKCCNPQHLREGTSQDNKNDAVLRDRHARGERVNTSKITERDVLALREMYDKGKTKTELAQIFNITLSTVSRIVSRQYWKHI